MANSRGFTVTENGEVTYTRTWPRNEWEIARDDYFLSLHQKRMGHPIHLSRAEECGTSALPYSCETGGVLVKIERAKAQVAP